MNVYETVFMTRPDLSDSQIKALTDKYTKLIADNGGKVLKTEDWGVRNLAYRINKNRKARYVLVEYNADGTFLSEIERLMGIEEDIMRSLNVRLDAASEGPSVVMQKSNDSDQDDNRKSGKEAA